MEEIEAKISLKDSLELIKDYCKKEYNYLNVKNLDYCVIVKNNFDDDYGSYTSYNLSIKMNFDKNIGNINIECDKIIYESEIYKILRERFDEEYSDINYEVGDISLPHIKDKELDLDKKIEIRFRKVNNKVLKKKIS